MRLSRRRVLGGASEEQCRIASMVVQCLPAKLGTTAANLELIENVSVPERDQLGKLIVLIEAPSESDLMASISEIESTPGVISANLVYHQIGD